MVFFSTEFLTSLIGIDSQIDSFTNCVIFFCLPINFCFIVQSTLGEMEKYSGLNGILQKEWRRLCYEFLWNVISFFFLQLLIKAKNLIIASFEWCNSKWSMRLLNYTYLKKNSLNVYFEVRTNIKRITLGTSIH